MKLLLDENLPKKLKQAFGDTHQVFTVGDMKWNGKRNGELLGLMVYHGFEGLVTIDKNLSYQQNINKFDLIIIVLEAPNNKIETLKPFVTAFLELAESPFENKVVSVQL